MRKSINTIIIALVCSTLSIMVYDHFRSVSIDTIEENYAQFVSDNSNHSPSTLVRSAALGEMSFIEPANKAKNSVVGLESIQVKEGGFRKDKYSKSNGSGVIISANGFIVTNYHVVENADDINITLEDRREFKAELIGYDRPTDIAVIKIDASALSYLEFGNSDDLQIGEWVLAIGNPFKLSSSVTAGIVSAKARSIDIFKRPGIESFIQTDAAINPGNSGGPLLDSSSRLIGVNTMIYSPSGGSAGIGFSIPVDVVSWAVPDIIKYGKVIKPIMGVEIIRQQLANQWELKGVMLAVVSQGSGAEKAGLKGFHYNNQGFKEPGDVITKINNHDIKNNNDLFLVLEKYKPGDEVEVQFIRDNKTRNTTVELGSSI